MNTTCIAHPFPSLIELTEEQALVSSGWKLEYIWYLVKNTPWKDTAVQELPNFEKNSGPVLQLTRMDGKQFPLLKSTPFFYVMYGDDGLELINVEKLIWKVPDWEDSERPEKQWCIKYNRVLRTEIAMTQCTEEDFGIRHRIALGGKSLRKIWEEQQNGRQANLIFHKGDYRDRYETVAKYIVGFVPWDSVPYDGNQDLKGLKRQINHYLKKARSFLRIQLNEIDWVFCGQDFSEIT